MSDIDDLQGVFPTTLRWNAEGGAIGYSAFDEESGERTIKPIELGSQSATFVIDLLTRERGYGLIQLGLYNMRLSPVGTAVPEYPGDEFKPAVGYWGWNPIIGEVRIETNAFYFRGALVAAVDSCLACKEAVDGQQPVLLFAGRAERFSKQFNRSFWSPILQRVGWIEREKLPTISLRPPTVPKPSARPTLEDLRASLRRPTG